MKVVLWTLVAIGVMTAGSFAMIYWQNAQVPTLGVVDGRFQPLSENPNGVSTQAEDPQKRVATWAMKETPSQTIAALEKAVTAYGGVEIKQQGDNYLYVVFTTPLMKYRDDAEFWLDTSTSQVHFRSASRAGKSDLGLNRQRYEALAKLYQE